MHQRVVWKVWGNFWETNQRKWLKFLESREIFIYEFLLFFKQFLELRNWAVRYQYFWLKAFELSGEKEREVR